MPFAFRSLGCVHVELKDRRLQGRRSRRAGVRQRASPGPSRWICPATRRRSSGGCRAPAGARCARREKVGVTVEQAAGGRFAEEYYGQLVDVFARQSLVPTYGVERVRALIECLRADRTAAAARARCRPTGADRHRHLPGVQRHRVLLGRRERARAPDPQAQRGHLLACDALLARARDDGARPRAEAATTSSGTGRASCGCRSFAARASRGSRSYGRLPAWPSSGARPCSGTGGAVRSARRRAACE